MKTIESIPPFAELAPDDVATLLSRTRAVDYAAGAVLPRGGVVLVRSGCVELGRAGQVFELALDGDSFGYEELLGESVEYEARTTVESSVYVLAPLDFAPILSSPAIQRHFSSRARRRRWAWEQAPSPVRMDRIDPFLRLHVRGIEYRPPLFIASGTPVVEAAGLMHQAGVAVCLVRGQKGTIGIVTEWDMLKHSAAPSKARVVDEIMNSPLVTIGEDELLAEAFARMLRHGIRRLVVVSAAGEAQGVIEERDLVSVRGENPIRLDAEIAVAGDIGQLQSLYSQVRGLTLTCLAEGVDIGALGRLSSALYDRIIEQVATLTLAQLEHGPPLSCALVLLGSEGRKEQYLGTDQDTAMILSDATASDSWYPEFARRFSGNMLAVGFPCCEHGVTADNPVWRMGLDAWKRTIDALVSHRESDAVLRISLLADLRHVWGDASLTAALREHLHKRIRSAPAIVKYLAREAVRFAPPLGVFSTFAVEKSGPNKGALDVKKGGIFPLTMGLKTMALDKGLVGTGTLERLERLLTLGMFAPSTARAIREAFRLFQVLRMRRQADNQRHGRPLDSAIRPDELSTGEREGLKAALKTVSEFQAILRHKYGLRLLP